MDRNSSLKAKQLESFFTLSPLLQYLLQYFWSHLGTTGGRSLFQPWPWIPSPAIQSNLPEFLPKHVHQKNLKFQSRLGMFKWFFQTWLHTRALPVTLPGPQGLRGRGGPWRLKRHHPPGCCSRPHHSSSAGGSQQRPGGAAGAGGWGCHLLEKLRGGLPRWTLWDFIWRVGMWKVFLDLGWSFEAWELRLLFLGFGVREIFLLGSWLKIWQTGSNRQLSTIFNPNFPKQVPISCWSPSFPPLSMRSSAWSWLAAARAGTGARGFWPMLGWRLRAPPEAPGAMRRRPPRSSCWGSGMPYKRLGCLGMMDKLINIH